MDDQVKKRWNEPQLLDLNLDKTNFVWQGSGVDGLWISAVNPPSPPPPNVFGS
ncbi:hypothetical protein [Desulfosporosinus youngiae]|nr:hypothetical protein [Desulfosporosinus youngiae]